MRTVGRVQQLCCREDNGLLHLLLYISVATDGNDLLLLQNCLQHNTQSNTHLIMIVQQSSTLFNK